MRIADCSVCSARLLWRKRTPDVQARAQATISQTMKTSAANLPKKKKAEQHRHVNLLKLPKPLPESRALARSRHCDRGGAAAVKQRPRPRGSRARDLLRTLPRVSLANLKPNPGSRKLVSGWWRCGQALAHGAMEAALHCPRFPGTAYSRGYWDGGRVSESLFSLTAEENLLAWSQLVIRFILKSITMLGRRSEVALQNDCPVQNWN